MNLNHITPAAALLLAAALATSPGASSAATATTTASGDGVIVWTQATSLESVDVTGQLIIANADGSGQRVLTARTKGVNDIDATVSPDGSRVLFTRGTADSAEQRLVPTAGGPSRRIRLGCSGSCLGDDKGTWLSKSRIAFTRFVESEAYPSGYAAILYSAKADGSHVSRLSPEGKDGVYEELYARFAPGHAFVVFSRVRIRDGATAVFRMQPDRSDVRRLTPWRLNAQLPHISPASSGPTAGLVVFQTFGEGNPDGTSRDLATVAADCASPQACRESISFVTHNGMGTGRASNPAWSPRRSPDRLRGTAERGRPRLPDRHHPLRRHRPAHGVHLAGLRLPAGLGSRISRVGGLSRRNMVSPSHTAEKLPDSAEIDERVGSKKHEVGLLADLVLPGATTRPTSGPAPASGMRVSQRLPPPLASGYSAPSPS